MNQKKFDDLRQDKERSMLLNDGYKRHILDAKNKSDMTVHGEQDELLTKQDIAM